MSGSSAVWTAASGIALLVTLVAIAGLIHSLAKLRQMRRDLVVADAAEQLRPVNLSPVVRRYLTARQQSHRAAEEIVLVKQAIAASRPHWMRIGILSAIVMLAAAGATAWLVHHTVRLIASRPSVRSGAPTLDVLAVIPGVWGWKADFLQSCSQNPQTITVSPDRKRLMVQYAKPVRSGSRMVSSFDFVVVDTQSDTISLAAAEPPETPGPRPTSWVMKFLDRNTYLLSRSDLPLATTGAIERCR